MSLFCTDKSRLPRLTLLVGVTLSFLLPMRSSALSDDRPIVVFREDDGRATWRTPYNGLGGVSALQYGKSKRIPVTWGIVTGFTAASGNGAYLNWAEIRDYLSTAGGEVASHSHTHSARPTTESYISELTTSRSAIETNIPGYTCTTFLQPGAWGASPDASDTLHANMDTTPELDNAIGRTIQSTYKQSMAYLGTGWMVGPVDYRYGLTNSYGIDFQNNQTIPMVYATLDIVANTPGCIFVIACHGVQETADTQTYHVQANLMKAVMDRLADLRDAGKIRLMSLNDAYHTAFASDLNHVPDPGFELCNPAANPMGPWRLAGAASIADSGGIENTRYGVVASTSATLRCGDLVLSPGRYELSWYQRVQPGFPTNKPLQLQFINWEPATLIAPVSVINNAYYYNSAPNIWERKSALLMIRDKFPSAVLRFISGAGAGYGVDNVSLVKVSVDRAISPVNTVATVTPNACRVSWDTPVDAGVTSVRVRYGTTTHPLSPTEGIALGEVSAVGGSRQEVTQQIDWQSLSALYISTFAVKADGTFSPPDLAVVLVDKTAPGAPTVQVNARQSGSADAQWSGSDAQSGVYQFKYAVGTAAGGSDVAPWTLTPSTSTVLTGLASYSSLYLSVAAQNLFGFWSGVTSVPIMVERKLGDAVALPDGSPVSVRGLISAVFSDCCYLEQNDRTRGIKLIGNISGFKEGDLAAIGGAMTTVSGERAILLQ